MDFGVNDCSKCVLYSLRIDELCASVEMGCRQGHFQGHFHVHKIRLSSSSSVAVMKIYSLHTVVSRGPGPGFWFRGQVKRRGRKNRGAAGTESMWGGSMGLGVPQCPLPRNCFHFSINPYIRPCIRLKRRCQIATIHIETMTISRSRTAYFGAFSGPSECLLLHCNNLSTLSQKCETVALFCDSVDTGQGLICPGPDLQYAYPLWHYRLTVAQSKARWSFCRREHYLPWWWQI